MPEPMMPICTSADLLRLRRRVLATELRADLGDLLGVPPLMRSDEAAPLVRIERAEPRMLVNQVADGEAVSVGQCGVQLGASSIEPLERRGIRQAGGAHAFRRFALRRSIDQQRFG